MLFTKSTKQPLPPKCIVAAVQQQMDWAGSNAPIALAALHDHSKITEFHQTEELPIGSVVMDYTGSVLHKVKPDLWKATGSADHWRDTHVVLPAHVLTWGTDHPGIE
jgi:hypothetical protein